MKHKTKSDWKSKYILTNMSISFKIIETNYILLLLHKNVQCIKQALITPHVAIITKYIQAINNNKKSWTALSTTEMMRCFRGQTCLLHSIWSQKKEWGFITFWPFFFFLHILKADLSVYAIKTTFRLKRAKYWNYSYTAPVGKHEMLSNADTNKGWAHFVMLWKSMSVTCILWTANSII